MSLYTTFQNSIHSSFWWAPISWKTKKHFVVSLSSVEAEYHSMASTVSEVLQVKWLLQELNIASAGPTPLFCDNQTARHIANNHVFHKRINGPNTLNWIVFFFVNVSTPKRFIRATLTPTCRLLIFLQKGQEINNFVSYLTSWALMISMLQLEGEYWILHINLLLFPYLVA